MVSIPLISLGYVKGVLQGTTAIRWYQEGAVNDVTAMATETRVTPGPEVGQWRRLTFMIDNDDNFSQIKSFNVFVLLFLFLQFAKTPRSLETRTQMSTAKVKLERKRCDCKTHTRVSQKVPRNWKISLHPLLRGIWISFKMFFLQFF